LLFARLFAKQGSCVMASIKMYFSKDGEARFLANVRRNGVSKSQSFETPQQAQRWAEDRETEIRLGHLTRKTYNMITVREGLEKYRKEVTAQKKSKRNEGYLINRIEQEDFVDLKLEQVTTSILEKMKNRRLAEGIGAQNIRHEMGLLRHMFKKALTVWEMEFKNPFDKFEFPKPPKHRTRRLNPVEMIHFLNCLNDYYVGGREFQLFIKWQLETSMRRGETLGMTWRDVDWNNTMVYLETTKNGESRDVPLGPDGIAILLQLRLNQRKPFENMTAAKVGYHWRRLVKIAGLGNFHLHDCRRDAISRLSEQGLMPQEIQKISGHKKLGQLMTYLAVEEKHVVDRLIQLAAE
jgi:integrase